MHRSDHRGVLPSCGPDGVQHQRQFEGLSVQLLCMDADLDLVKLRTLVEIRATGSMTAAAAALGYTTGAVSQQMATLQRSLRLELFTQVGRSVQLTDAGQ
jgi:hypothetical protein